MKTSRKIIILLFVIAAVAGSVWAVSVFAPNEGAETKQKAEAYLDTIVKSDTSPKTSSNPYDYIEANRQAYNDLVALGEPGLNVMLSMFEKSGGDGLYEYIMAIACDEILGKPAEGSDISSGREWFDRYGKAYIKGAGA